MNADRRMSDFLNELLENPQTPEEIRRKSSLFLDTLPNTFVSPFETSTPVTPTSVPLIYDNPQSTRIVIKQEPVHQPPAPSPVYPQEAGVYPPVTNFIFQELARNPAFAMQVASMFLTPQQQTAMLLPYMQQPTVVPNFEPVQAPVQNNLPQPKSDSPAPAQKTVTHAPGEAYILLRGARKSVFADLNAVQELNSLPYKYCFKLVLPFLSDADYHAKVSSENISFELLCMDSAQESVVENGITVEKLMRTKRYADRRELEYKVYLSAYSHGFNKNAFIIKVYDNKTGHVILRSQALPIFARRNQSAQPHGETPKKRKRESSGEGSPVPKRSKQNKSQ